MGDWKVSFEKNGKINAVEIKLYCNSGYTDDSARDVMDRALFHSNNCYNFENFKVSGFVCK